MTKVYVVITWNYVNNIIDSCKVFTDWKEADKYFEECEQNGELVSLATTVLK